jgi:hypothetical protein
MLGLLAALAVGCGSSHGPGPPTGRESPSGQKDEAGAPVDRQTAISTISSMGGEVYPNRPDKPVEKVSFADTGAKDKDLALLRPFGDTVKLVDLAECPITDGGLEHLKGLTNIRTLNLLNTKVTDKGLESLSGLTTLQFVNAAGTQITDQGIKSLKKKLPKVRVDLPGRE